MLWRQEELVKDEEGHFKSRKDGEKKKPTQLLNKCNSANGQIQQGCETASDFDFLHTKVC